MKRIVLALACLALLTIAGTAAAQGLRIALVVGSGAYRNVPALANPARDARSIAEALSRAGFKTELVLDPDRSALERAVRNLGARSRAADVALFFFAGHAVEYGGKNYLVPVSANIQSGRDLPFETVETDLVTAQMDGAARTSLIFLDACRDNPFALRLSATERGLAGRGLAAPGSASTGTLVAFATAPGRTASDGSGDHSPFTRAILSNIETPGLEIRQLLSRVRRQVREETNGQQVPWESSALEGEFYFRPMVAGGAASNNAALPPSSPNSRAPVVPPPPDAPSLPSSPSSAQPLGRPSPAPSQPQLALVAPAPNLPPPTVPRSAAGPARRCLVSGEHWSGGQVMVRPLMQVSNEGGSCTQRVGMSQSTVLSMVIVTRPAHGKLTVSGDGTTSASYTYTPEPGFDGEDSFVINTGNGGQVQQVVRVLVGR